MEPTEATVPIEAQPETRQPDESSQGRPKRKRAVAKVNYDESSADSDGSGSDFETRSVKSVKTAKKGATKAKPKATKATKSKAPAKAKTPRAKAQPKEPKEAKEKPEKPEKEEKEEKPEAKVKAKAAPKQKSKPAEVHAEVQRPRRAAASRSAAASAVMATGDAIVDTKDADDDDVYKRLFAPMTDKEIQQWQGWCEIESEPDFFNFILHELGVRNACVQEVYGIDKETLRSLSNPLGLIFLYKYVEEDEADVGDGCPDALWFANQTTDNACGTVAMLNICMNHDTTVQLGPHLSAFRDTTRDLHPALRGHMLSSDAYIRAKHNSFARRLDMLAADAHLRESWEEDVQKKKRKKASRFDEDEAAFHFIAYVPQGDDVWELNGMQEWPLKLAHSADKSSEETEHWTSRASERIAARVQGYAEEAGFVLLAVCGTDSNDNGNSNGTASESSDDMPELRVAAARKGDYTPAVYCWLKKLADKGLLRGLATGEQE